VWYVVGIAIPSVAALAGWFGYLLFCRFLVKHTNSSASLKDAAVAARAYRSAGFAQLGQAFGRILRLPRGSG
jgi:hypothetical protein